MADKSTQLIVTALSRAATEPAGVALFAGKSEEGLFPATAAAKPAAERCLDEGLLAVVRTETKGRSEREIVSLTDKGLSHLATQTNPRHVLEDFVRALEFRQEQAAELKREAERMAASLDSMRRVTEQILPRLGSPMTNGHAATNGALPADYVPQLMARLTEWHATSGASEDCPLPELYRRVAPSGPPPTVGQFHDCLRRLHDEDRIYLHPWTGPLYAMPEPRFALLAGHEIAYYASSRQ